MRGKFWFCWYWRTLEDLVPITVKFFSITMTCDSGLTGNYYITMNSGSFSSPKSL
jgi:hypothetical protein